MSWQVVILRRDGQEEGPLSEEEVLDLLDAGELSADEWCRVVGQPHEQRVGELFETISPPTPEPAPVFEDLGLSRAGDAETGAEGPVEFPDLADGALEEIARRREQAPASGSRQFRSLPRPRPPAEVLDGDSEEEEPEHPFVSGVAATAESAHAGPLLSGLDVAEEEIEDAAEDEEGEQLVYVGCPSWLNYAGTFLLAALSLVGGYYAGALGGWWLGGGLALALALVSGACLARARWEFRVTTERVEAVRGLLARSHREIRLQDIRAINVESSGVEGLLGVGTLTFSSMGGREDDVVFRGVRGARRLRQLVRELQSAA